MLQEAHIEEWGEAERSLQQVQETVGRLLREVGEKSRKTTLAPTADKGRVPEEE